jgi:tetratricopeptide (TPR) repeat protein
MYYTEYGDKKSATGIGSNIYVIHNNFLIKVNMYPIKLRFWTGCLLTSLVCLPLGFVNQTKVLAVEPVVQIAQKNSAYEEYMRRGYKLTRLRNYTGALRAFQKALEIRPDDRYATTAIRNITIYIARRQNRNVNTISWNRPGRRTSAASRASGFGFVALTPSDEEIQRTTAEHPTFFFYIPESQKTRELKFVLQEADAQTTKPLYEKPFPLVGKKGIVSVSIPQDKAPLKTGKEYIWTCSLSYPLEPDVPDERIKGKIQRVQDETIANQIQQTTEPLDQVELYIKRGFWENSLRILANLRREYPNDPEVELSWTSFLKSVNLEAVANESLL